MALYRRTKYSESLTKNLQNIVFTSWMVEKYTVMKYSGIFMASRVFLAEPWYDISTELNVPQNDIFTDLNVPQNDIFTELHVPQNVSHNVIASREM